MQACWNYVHSRYRTHNWHAINCISYVFGINTQGIEAVDYEPLIGWVYEEYPELKMKVIQRVCVLERGEKVFEELPGKSTRHLQTHIPDIR